MPILRIALAQINTTVGDLAGNSRKILDYTARAKKSHADIVVFPELAVTGYPPEDLLLKEHFVQDNIRALRMLAKKVSKITAVVGFVDMDRKKNLYNAAAVIPGGGIKGIYHKRDLPNYGVFDEKRYFTEGQVHPLFRYDGVIMGVNICEDIWTDKGVHRSQAKAGARVFINISSSPYDFGKLKVRENLLIKRARQNKVYVCYVNLVGGQDELVFDGASRVISPDGKVMAAGRQFEEDLIIVDLPVKPAKKRQTKAQKYIALHKSPNKKRGTLTKQLAKELRPIEGIYHALVLGTKDYVQKNGFKKVVIGLSGGIDSSLVAVIAREAMGRENVIGISMPSQYTSKGTKTDAKKLAENLGIQFMEIPIHRIFEVYLDVLKEEFAGLKPSVAEENLQARIRGNILMTFSNKFGWLVLTTGNKSEVAVGYCTLYGDMSGGFSVIKDVPKTKVYEISRLINNLEGEWIPESVLTRAPTAELRDNQKDQDSLPPYETLDPLIQAYVEEHKSMSQMVKRYNHTQVVKEIITMVDRSEYKRRQSPPGIKITPRAFGKDWRLPITNKYKEK